VIAYRFLKRRLGYAIHHVGLVGGVADALYHEAQGKSIFVVRNVIPMQQFGAENKDVTTEPLPN